MNKIKVMHVITDLNFGGAGKYLYQICKHIDKDKFEIRVVVPEGSVLNNIISSLPDIDVIEIKGIDTKSFDIMGVKEIYGLIKLYKPDIIHSHACLSARIAGLMAGNKKIIYTRHSLLPKMKGVKRLGKIMLGRILPSKIIAENKSPMVLYLPVEFTLISVIPSAKTPFGLSKTLHSTVNMILYFSGLLTKTPSPSFFIRGR
jgi:hypothetical protein